MTAMIWWGSLSGNAGPGAGRGVRKMDPERSLRVYRQGVP
jgi:hypothetical protein